MASADAAELFAQQFERVEHSGAQGAFTDTVQDFARLGIGAVLKDDEFNDFAVDHWQALEGLPQEGAGFLGHDTFGDVSIGRYNGTQDMIAAVLALKG